MLALMISFILPAYADTVLFMKPVTKEIEKSDANKIIKNLEANVKSKLNSISYQDVSKAKLKKFGKCGMKPECWSENASDEDFQYVLLSLISMNEDEEVTVRLVLINIEEEEVVDDESKTYDYADDANEKAIFAQIRKMSAFGDIKGGSKGKSSDKERKKKERELEEKRKEEERLAKEREKKKRLEEERKRREEEEEIERLERERAKREAEKKKEMASKKQSLKDNAKKLEKARELVLEMCSEGKYNAAIKAITSEKISNLKCECEEDAKILALKTQLLNFNRTREQILKGVEVKNSSLILDNIEAAKALDESIVPGGTEFSQKVDKYAAIGWLARGKEMEKANKYVEANEAYEKCVEIDPEKTECSDWLNSKDKIVKAIYDKASVMKNFNPTKAKELLRSILKIVTAENEHYKKAEKDLQQLEY